MQAQANAIAKEVESQQGPTGLADKEIIALTAYLQRLGTDTRWKRPVEQAPYSATLQAPPAPATAPAASPAAASAAPAAPATPTAAAGAQTNAPHTTAAAGGRTN